MSKRKRGFWSPYIKTGIGALVGACIGLLAVIFFNLTEGAADTVQKAVKAFIRDKTVFLLFLDVFSMLAVSLFTYYRVEKLMKKKNTLEQMEDTDAEVDLLECRMEGMGTVATVCNYTLFLMLFVFLGAYLETERGSQIASMVVGIFILGSLIYPLWEIAYVRQSQRWDPTKKGDPGDLRFNKQWLKSCDEGERQIIYQSAYKTFRLTQTVLLAMLAFTFTSNLFWDTGLLAIVVVVILSVLMTGAYMVFAMRLKKSKLG